MTAEPPPTPPPGRRRRRTPPPAGEHWTWADLVAAWPSWVQIVLLMAILVVLLVRL